jgi:flavorubredoxin
MRPVEVAKNIYDVGVNDWNIQDFHGYSTPLGTSYNAFLILDEKNVLIDTVKHGFEGEMLDRISQIIDPQKIDIVISNHTEMDHSGGLERVMALVGENKPLYCSKMGQKNLASHFKNKWNYHAVANGEELNIGSRTLTFLETRMLHWPDSMFTYIKEDKILFSSDAFGQHYAGNEKFDDVIGDAIMPHAKKYYTNILMHFSPQVKKLLDTVTELGLEFKMICPDHGILWRENPSKIVNAYEEWSRQPGYKKAIVVYDSMWHSTEMMAEAIASGLDAEGVEVRPMSLKKWHRSDVMTEIMDAKAILVGSPTLNNGLFPTVADMLTYMKGLRPKNKIAAAFGSYGWSGEAVKCINAEFEAMKLDIVDPGLKIQFVPTRDALEECYAFGRRIGVKISEMLAASK